MKVITPEFRVSFPKVFKAEFNKMSKKEEFSVVALFKHGQDLSALKTAIKAVLTEEFGPDQTKWPKNIRSPLRDQGEKIKVDEKTGKEVIPAGHEKGAIFLNLKSKTRPGVVDQSVQPIIDESEFYAGCWAIASVNAYFYDQAGNKGVSFGLNNLQKVRDGDPLGGRSKPEADFAPIAGAADTAKGDAASLFD